MRSDDPRLKKAIAILKPTRIYKGWAVKVDEALLLTLALIKAEIATEPMLLTVREQRQILRQRHEAQYRGRHPHHRRRIFSAKVRGLLDRSGLTQKEAAEKWGMPHKLLRRWATEGVAQPSSRTAEEMQKLCDELGLADVAELWKQ